MGYKVKDEREGGMRYSYRGHVFPSVTTIISGGVPKPLLVPWAAKVTAEWVVENIEEVNRLIELNPDDALTIIKGARFKSSNKAANLGTRLHDIADKHINGEKLPTISKDLEGYVKAYLRFLDEYKPVPLLTEKKVFSLTHDYAGTFDAIVEIDGENYLIDYKTGKGVYPEVALQLAAYRYAEFYMDEDGNDLDLPRIDKCAVVHLRPRSYGFIPVRADEEVFKYFRAVRKVFDFSNEGDGLIGKKAS